MDRRDFIGSLPVLGTAASLTAAIPAAVGKRPRILLRESLQYENIGDSGRVPGTLRLLSLHLAEPEVTLWPWSLHETERKLLLATFPRLRIVEGAIDGKGNASTAELAKAWKDADFFVCPGKGREHYEAWARTDRPFGLFGTAFDPVSNRAQRPDGGTVNQLKQDIERLPAGDFAKRWGDPALYAKASFIFCRDTISLGYLRAQKIGPAKLEFGPEGAFAIAVRDDRRAEAWLKRHALESDRYLCVIPRLRYTPYYRIKNLPRSPGDHEIDALNARWADQDHQAMREMIVRWVRETGGKVAACPEMTYQIETARLHLVEPLPDDVKRQVVWRDEFWLPNEAASIFARAAAVVSADCHSPIIALANGTPALHVRNPTDTVKAQMFRDIGAGDWLFEVGETTGEILWEKLGWIHQNLPQARAKVKAIMAGVSERQRQMVGAIGSAVATRSS
ncbi:MAG: hypothetical protein RIQ93_2311 [Verrucomicrobiota bacterium]